MNKQIENNFRYYEVAKEQADKLDYIRVKAKDLAYMLDELCPNSREKSLAMTKLEEAVMWANVSIARNGED